MGPLWRQLATVATLAVMASAVLPRTFVYNATQLEATKKLVQQGDATLKASLAAAVATADDALLLPLTSVMDKPYTPPSGDKHDYMSLDKYYWPCNAPPPGSAHEVAADCDKKTGLPYVRHDGVVNPDMHKYDHDALVNMTQAVTALGIAYYFTDEEKYAEHAAALLETWFLGDKAMNANLNFGHFIPGVANGSHGAMIDVHNWPLMLDGVSLLAGASSWTSSKEAAMRAWMTEFTHWVATSPFGQGEAAETNNHGVWYDVLLSGCALYCGKTDLAAVVARDAMQKRLDYQIQPDGQLPAELARTKSFSYTEFCTDALLTLTALAANSGVDLTHEKGHGSSRLRTTLDWQEPYVTGAKKWNYTQIVPFYPPECVITAVDQCIGLYFSVFRRAANAYHSSTYEKVALGVPGVDVKADVLNLVYPQTVKV